MNQTKSHINSTVFTSMSEHTLLSIKGPDAEKFLQGQCTCDLKQAEDGRILMGAHCNAKGRAISSFILIKASANEYYLRVRKNNHQSLLTALSKYSVFSKVSIHESKHQGTVILLADEHPIPPFALPQPKHHQQTSGTQTILNHGNQCIEIWADYEHTQSLTHSLEAIGTSASHEIFDAHLINHGLVEIQQPIEGDFIPQDLNYQLVDAISFTKGCYTGQEIVARMQYRGKLKKHTYRAIIHTASNVAIGSHITFENSEKTIGIVVSVNPMVIPDTEEVVIQALICTTEEAFQSSEPLVEQNSKAEISWLSLPYAIT